jgi:hypothetical protein
MQVPDFITSYLPCRDIRLGLEFINKATASTNLVIDYFSNLTHHLLPLTTSQYDPIAFAYHMDPRSTVVILGPLLFCPS